MKCLVAVLLSAVILQGWAQAVTCKLDGKEYPVGKIPGPDPCRTVECTAEGAIQRRIWTCGGGCPPGTNAVNVTGECCPTCQPKDDVCVVDGKEVKKGASVPNDNPCFTCTCQGKGSITCQGMTCPSRCEDGSLPKKVNGKCCPECVTSGDNRTPCIVNGTEYNKGQTIPTNDPCHTCTCGDKGVRSCIYASCAPCRGKTTPVPGQCCPKCDTADTTVPCKVGGKDYKFGETIPGDDKCTTCICGAGGARQCNTTRCTNFCLDKNTRLDTSSGDCCPRCVPIKGTDCTVEGILYKNGDAVNSTKPCDYCRCEEGEVLCSQAKCGRCPDGSTYQEVPGRCCGKCVRGAPVSECVVNGHAYQVNDTIKTDNPCASCKCTQVGTYCFNMTCDACPAGYRQVAVKGKCCPDCVPEANRTDCKDDDGKSYSIGQEMPNTGVDNANCSFCYCAGPNQKQCKLKQCREMDCPAGWAPFKRPQDCCTGCKQCATPYQIAGDNDCEWNCAAGTEPDEPNYTCKCKDGYTKTKNKDALGRIVCEVGRQDPCAKVTCPDNQVCQLDNDLKPSCAEAKNLICEIQKINKCAIQFSGRSADVCDFLKTNAGCGLSSGCTDLARVYCDQNFDPEECPIDACDNSLVKASKCTDYNEFRTCYGKAAKITDNCQKWKAMIGCSQDTGCLDWQEGLCASLNGHLDGCPDVDTACSSNTAKQTASYDMFKAFNLPSPLEKSSSHSTMTIILGAVVVAVATIATVAAVIRMRRRSAAPVYVEMQDLTPQ